MRNIPTELKKLDNAFLKWAYLECRKKMITPSDNVLLALFNANLYGQRSTLKNIEKGLK